MKPKSKIVTAGVVAALAVLLVGGSGSLAYLKDESSGPEAKISAGSLEMIVSGPVVGHTVSGTVPAGVVQQPGSEGVIPGIQNQTLTYTVTNTGTERAVAKLTGTLASTGTSSAYASVYPHLQIAVSIDDEPEAVVAAGSEVVIAEPAAPRALTNTGFTGAPIPASDAKFLPGAAHARTVTVTVSIPDSKGTLAHSLLGARTKALVSIQPTFTLTQTPIG